MLLFGIFFLTANSVVSILKFFFTVSSKIITDFAFFTLVRARSAILYTSPDRVSTLIFLNLEKLNENYEKKTLLNKEKWKTINRNNFSINTLIPPNAFFKDICIL